MNGDSNRPASVWIVHRDERARAALARLAAASDDALLGEPGDPQFEAAPAPRAVVLGLGGDFERELEFAHRMLPRMRDCAWILSPEREDAAEAKRLFGGLAKQLLPYPPEPGALRRAIGLSLQRRSAQSLPGRRNRDRLTTRFAHWFGDLEIPGLMRALDPNLASLPLLVSGESGSGRELLARYVHSFGSDREKSFIPVACRGADREAHLLSQLEDAAASVRNAGGTIWLDEVDLLPVWLQRRLKDWIEFGLPESAAALEPVRWMASAGDDRDWASEQLLDPQLSLMLSALPLYAPNLRMRPEAIARFAREAASGWSKTSGLAERHFSEEAIALLQAHPWPGNLRELEAAIVRTLSSTSGDPVQPEQLRFEAEDDVGSADTPRPIATLQPSDENAEALDVPAASFASPMEASPAEAAHLAPAAPTRKPVDIAAILDSALDDLRVRIQSRRLLVLKELDRGAPFVMGDSDELRGALAGLLSRALASVPERGDVYLASSHHPNRLGGQPSVRVLLRYRRTEADAEAPFDPEGMAPAGDEASSQELARAEQVVRDHGGTLTVDAADRRERVIVIDLPAAPEAAAS